jgi:hypothetical protein
MWRVSTHLRMLGLGLAVVLVIGRAFQGEGSEGLVVRVKAGGW